MPGILGFCGPLGPNAGDALLQASIRALGVEPRYRVDCFSSAELGLARVHLGLIDPQPQPLWSADRQVALVMTGEIFSWDGLQPQDLPEHLPGYSLDPNDPCFNNAAVLLAAYRRYGEACVDHVNGTFAAAIWDAAAQTLLLVNDHIGSYPLYYAQQGATLLFGSGARAVAQGLRRPRVPNTEAIAQLVAFEHLYGDNTLFAGVKFLLPGTVLRFHAGQITQRRYIDFQFPETYELHDEAYYVDELLRLTQQAVTRQSRGPAPLGVLLTGGLDSRTILGMLAGGGAPVRTVTFGIPDCDDEHAARELAQVLRVPHKFYPLAPDYLAHLGAEGVRLSDGQGSVVHFNVFGALAQVTQEARVLYKGYLGGTIHGDVVTPERLAPQREECWVEQVFDARNRIFKEAALPELYTDAMHAQVRDVPRRTIRQALARSHAAWWVDNFNYLDLYEGDVRHTAVGVELARRGALVRTPFADKDLLRFVVTVPPGIRLGKSYYRKAIVKALPKLARVEYSGTHQPLNEQCLRAVRLRTRELTGYWLQNHGVKLAGRLQPGRPAHPYADYGQWFRRELRPWVEETLLSRQALDRGYFRAAHLRQVVAEHMGGCDHTRKLGVLLTLELWHRQFAD